MNYPMRLYTVETVEGPEWIAEFVDIFGCGGGGNTAQEALEDALINLEYYLGFAKERGEDVCYPPIRMFTKIIVVWHTAKRLPMNCK